jgi:hypothetical protein
MFFAAFIVVASSIEEQLEEYKDYFTGECATPPKGGSGEMASRSAPDSRAGDNPTEAFGAARPQFPSSQQR